MILNQWSIKRNSSELLLLGSIIYYWILTAQLLNPFAIGLLATAIYLTITNKSTLGLLFAVGLIGLTLFMALALISELSEFTETNSNYHQLLIFGSLYLGFNLVLGSALFLKYIKLKIH